MKDEVEPFEQRLRQQPLKEIPADWRAEILTVAREAQATRHSPLVTRHNWLSTLNHRLSTFFWPHPKAWAGLAVVWVFIFVLNFSMRDRTPMVVEKSTPPSPEMIVELKKQQLMLAELVGTRETPDADRQKLFSPRPRSERVEISMT